MKKINRILAVFSLFAISVLAFTSCDGKISSGQEASTEESASDTVRICTYFSNEDGTALANTQLIVNNSGEELTYKTDYLGYVEFTLPVGETAKITAMDENGNRIAAGEITLKRGDSFSFGNQDKEQETLTVPQESALVFASFSITKNQHFTCTELS